MHDALEKQPTRLEALKEDLQKFPNWVLYAANNQTFTGEVEGVKFNNGFAFVSLNDFPDGEGAAVLQRLSEQGYELFGAQEKIRNGE